MGQVIDRAPITKRKKAGQVIDRMPSYAKGGIVAETGKAMVHKGEKVIPKNKVKEYGHLASAMSGGAMSGMKMPKTSLSVTARMDSMGGYDSHTFQRSEAKRLRNDIKAIEKEVSGWNSEKVAAQALRSLKTDLAMKKARLMETEAMLEEKYGSDESDEDEGE